MNPFRVQCETCQSWLKVRDVAVVGQIHACPQCAGMVLLVPATAPSPPIPNALRVAATAAPIVSTNFESVDELGLDESPPAAPPVESPTEVLEPVPQPETLFETSPTESLGRNIALGIGAGGALLAVVGGLVMFLLRSDGPAEEVAAAPPVASLIEAPSVTSAPGPKPEPAVEVTTPKPALDRTDESPSQTPAEPRAETPELPPLPPPAVETPAVAVPPVQSAQQTPEQTGPAHREVDPLDYDPASLDLVLLRGPKQPDAAPTAEGQRPDDPTKHLDSQLAAPSDRPQERLASLDRRLADRAEVERVWVERGLTALEPQAPVDLAKRLGETVPEFSLPGAPLADAVRLWSDLVGVPVTIDPAALARAGVSSRTKVNLQGRDAPMSDILLTGLKPVRLAYAEQNGALVLTRLDGEQTRTASFDVRDLLAPGAKDATAIAQLASKMVLRDSASEQLTVDQTKLTLTAPAARHFDLAIFCERLRRARGLPQRTKYPAAMLSIRAPLGELAPALDKSVTFSFVTPTPLTEIVEHWRSVAGFEVLVDWASVAEAQLGPLSPVRCSVRDQSWRAALDGVLGPLGLGWRAVDGRTIQIAGRVAAKLAYPTVEFYPLTKSHDGESLAAQLTEATSQHKSAPVIRFGKPSGSLIVRGCGASHEFIYDWLTGRGLLN